MTTSTSLVLTDLPAPPAGKTGWPWRTEPREIPGGEWPRVSVVMPCRDAASYIEGSIRSILLQGYPDLELIVVDGGSTDGTIHIIRKYEPWLTRWISEPDRGQSHAINKGLALATGTYFNWHNADDWLTAGSLFDTVRGFHQYPDAHYICRHRLLLYEDGRYEAKRSNPRPGLIPLERALISACPGGQPGGLMLCASAAKVGGVDESFDCCMDEDLLMKLRLLGPGYYVDGPGVFFRVRSDQKSVVLLNERIAEKFRIIDRSFRHTDASLRYLKWSARMFAARHASGLCRQRGKPLRAALWMQQSRILRAIAFLRGVPVRDV